jgi:hypothetical protein
MTQMVLMMVQMTCLLLLICDPTQVICNFQFNSILIHVCAHCSHFIVHNKNLHYIYQSNIANQEYDHNNDEMNDE